jgi:hypothetical protein
MEIGKFFIDIKVPENNLYWKGRYLYITPMPGYLFIPTYVDLQYRLGLSKKELLSEEHACFIEAIMNSIGKEEFEKTGRDAHIKACVQIASAYCKNHQLLEELQQYFAGANNINGINFGLSLKALNRVDTYLFTLCFFDFDNDTKKKLIDAWHALMTFYLLTDDMDDMKDDAIANEDNAILDAGLSLEGVKTIETFMQQSYTVMNGINPVFANRIDYSWQHINVKKIIEDYLHAEGKSIN